jgi:hypothetical protein
VILDPRILVAFVGRRTETRRLPHLHGHGSELILHGHIDGREARAAPGGLQRVTLEMIDSGRGRRWWRAARLWRSALQRHRLSNVEHVRAELVVDALVEGGLRWCLA